MDRDQISQNHRQGQIATHSGLILQILMILILFWLPGCAPLDLSTSPLTHTPAPTGSKVVLPATWTQAPPSPTGLSRITPSPTTSPTITPTNTAAASPIPSLEQTQVSQDPSSTTDWTAGPLPDCTFTATETGIRIHPAPFIDPYHVLPTMEPGKAYPAANTKPTFTLLFEDGQPLGWVDYRLLNVTHEGDECLTRQDDREITDFPLCFFTPLEEIYGYADSEFNEPMHTLFPQTSFVLLRQSQQAYFTSYGSSGPSFLVKKEEVTIHGFCDNIPTLAKAIVETALYTDPPDQGGRIVYTLAVDESIFTQSQHKSGAPPPGAAGSGYWVLARRPSWSEDINGWVWSGHIEDK